MCEHFPLVHELACIYSFVAGILPIDPRSPRSLTRLFVFCSNFPWPQFLFVNCSSSKVGVPHSSTSTHLSITNPLSIHNINSSRGIAVHSPNPANGSTRITNTLFPKSCFSNQPLHFQSLHLSMITLTRPISTP